MQTDKKKYVSVVFVIFSRAYPFVGAFPIVLACKMATTNNNVSNKLLDNQLQLSIPTFHPKCGQLVTLSSNKRTAKRSNAAQEFNHGLIFSHTHLVSNQVCRYLTSVHLSKFLCSNSTDIKAFRMKVSDGSFVQFDYNHIEFWGGCIGQCCHHSEELQDNIFRCVKVLLPNYEE